MSVPLIGGDLMQGRQCASGASDLRRPRTALRFAVALLATYLTGTEAPAAEGGSDVPLYRQAAVPLEQRVEDLLGRMTLEEKIAQLTCIWNRKKEVLTPSGDFDSAKARQLFPAGIGQVARPSDLDGIGDPFIRPYRDARQTVSLVNAIQHYALEHTRLGIPVLFHEEGLHGYVAAMPPAFRRRSRSPAPGTRSW